MDFQKTFINIFLNTKSKSVSLITALYKLLVWPPRTFCLLCSLTLNFLLDKAKSTVLKLLFLWIILITLASFSILFYAFFYHVYIPTAEISKTVHLTFSVCPSGTGICSFPSGNVSFWNEQGTIQETLSAGQAYTVVLELEMPDSPANRELGMFMLSLKMIDREGQVSLTSERSAVLKYRSLVSRLFDLFVWSPFYFFGYSEEKQTLTVNMFTHYVDDYYHPSVGANIEVHSYKIEIYSATLNFFANFTGLKYFLYFWPITSAFLAFSFNLFILSLGMAMAAFQRSETLNNLALAAQLTSGENQNAITHQAKITVSKSTMTEDLDQPEQVDDKNDLPLIQEPADFHLEPGDDGMDFVNELRQRRIN